MTFTRAELARPEILSPRDEGSQQAWESELAAKEEGLLSQEMQLAVEDEILDA